MSLFEIDKEIRIMEVCGTHTMSILRSGVKKLLPQNIKLISGPGCPICVTSQGYIDACIELSKRENIIITTFGDMVNTPGSNGSLRIQRALGSDIKIVYSPLEAVNIAKKNSHKEVVFLGVGFETTAPTIALAIEKAYKEKIENFSVFTALKTMPEVIKMLLNNNEALVDGIICPGHVSTVIGEGDFKFISDEFEIPSVIAGFEDDDVIAAVSLLVDMIRKKQNKSENIYSRYVRYEGNKKAKEIINKFFQKDDSNWRGLGVIKNSGLKIAKECESFDAKIKFDIKIQDNYTSVGCICGQILQGKKEPMDCRFFGKECTPSNPKGVCMVSKEGTCGVHYKYINQI